MATPYRFESDYSHHQKRRLNGVFFGGANCEETKIPSDPLAGETPSCSGGKGLRQSRAGRLRAGNDVRFGIIEHDGQPDEEEGNGEKCPREFVCQGIGEPDEGAGNEQHQDVGQKQKPRVFGIDDFPQGKLAAPVQQIRLQQRGHAAEQDEGDPREQGARFPKRSDPQQKRRHERRKRGIEQSGEKILPPRFAGDGAADEKTGEQKAAKESVVDILTYEDYIEEAALSSKERNDLPASEFGLPKQRRYPLNDEKHVLLAIRFFNHVEEQYEKELARNIIRKVKEYNMADKVHVGKNNRFKPYWDKSGLANTNVEESSIEELFNFNLAETLYLVNNNEATFEVNDELKQQVGGNNGQVNKELNDKIQRFYQFNTKAIGAKMTQAVAAYKQYISLYKAVLGGNKQQNKENQNNQQSTTTTTTQQNTNNQQNQNNNQK